MRPLLRSLSLLLCTLCVWSTTLWSQIDTERVMTIGRNAIGFKDYVVAIEHFNQVIEVSPTMADPYYYRAFAKLMLGDYAGAERDATLCLERNPFLSRAYMVRGAARHNLQHYAEAATDYAQALKITPDDFYLSFNLAGSLYGAEQYERADSAALALTQRHPKEARGYFLAAEIALRRQDTVAAEGRIAEGLAIDSLSAAPYRMLSTIAYLRGDYEGALRYHDKSIALEPDQASDYINRGLTRYKLKEYRGAMEDYDQALLLTPHDAVARHNRALLRVEVGDLLGAREDLLEVVRQQPTNLTAHFNLALVQTQTGQYRAAIETLDYILGRRPEFLSGYYQRSEVKRLLGDAAGADRDYWLAYKLERGQIKPPKPTIADSTASSVASEELYALDHHAELQSASSDATPSSITTGGNSLRGSIQEQATSSEACPAYELTYFVQKSHDKLLPRSNFSAELEAYNERTGYQPRLLLAVGTQSLDSTQLHIVLEDIARLQASGAEQTADWHLRMGIDKLLLRDIGEAVRQFCASLDLAPQQPLALLAFTTARLMLAEMLTDPEPQALMYTLAMRELTTAISHAPQIGYLYYNRAHLHQTLGHTDQAIADYTKAIELLPQAGEAYYNRALLLEQQGQHEQAIDDLSRAGELGIYQAYSLIHTIQTR